MQAVVVTVVGQRRSWRHVERPDLPITTNLSRQIATREAMGQLRLPHLRRGFALRVASDYAGQDRRLVYRLISFIVTDDVSLRPWNIAREQIRARYLPHDERLSFKGLRFRCC